MSYLEGVRIDYDTADMITRLTLIESLKGINKDIAAKDDLKYREALLVIIRYFSTEEQMKEMKDD